MGNGGFTVVIGNPPWGAEFTDDELKYLRLSNKDIIVRMIDSFMYFVNQSSKRLRKSGYFGMILPDVILYQTDNEKLRDYLLSEFSINYIFNMGDVFEKVSRPASILIFKKIKPRNPSIKVTDLTEITKAEKALFINKRSILESVKQNSLKKIPKVLFVTSQLARYTLWSKVNDVPNKPLAEFVDGDGIQRGVSPDLKAAFLVDLKTANRFKLEKDKLKKVLTGGIHVKRYFIEHPDLLLVYTTRSDDFSRWPQIRSYIDQFKDQITCREVKQNKHPLYALHRPRKEHLFLKDNKIMGVITGDRIIVAPDDSQTYATDGLYLFGLDDSIDQHYLMGILNSSLFVFVYRLLAIEKGRVLPQVKPTILSNLPIRTINFKKKTEKSNHDQIVKLVKSIIQLRTKLSEAKTPHIRTNLQRQFAITDKMIDQAVYDLYNLSKDEILIVESETAN
jgi:hypothetical protein